MAKPDLKIRMVDLAYQFSLAVHVADTSKRSSIEHAIRRCLTASGVSTVLIHAVDDNTADADRSARLGAARPDA